MNIKPIHSKMATAQVVAHHYLHRRPPISFAFGLFDDDFLLIGVVTFGVPASRSVQKSACPTNPDAVLELNRLWVSDAAPRNTESWFVSRAIKLLPPRIVISYADTSAGHVGYVYRALNFYYAGWTDMDRKTPRCDYIVPGKHSRDAFRNGTPTYTAKVRRVPKIKYWTLTGDARERRELKRIAGWKTLSWKITPPPC